MPRAAPVMTATAERAAQRLAEAGSHAEMVGEMLTATFDVICEVALSGREHFDSAVYAAAILRYFETAGKASLLDFLRVPHWIPRPGELLGLGAVRTMDSGGNKHSHNEISKQTGVIKVVFVGASGNPVDAPITASPSKASTNTLSGDDA